MDLNSLTPNERAMYRELSEKIDGVKYWVFLLSVLVALVIWKLS